MTAARLIAVPFFFASAFLAPWWLVLAFAISLIAYLRASVSPIVGAFVVDTLYRPADTDGSFYFYTVLVAVLVLVAHSVRARLLE